MNEEQLIVGGVYTSGEEYAISDGKALYFLFDNIHTIDADVELNQSQGIKHLDGYCLRLKTKEKKWQIVDTGHKNCKDIIKEGNYIDDFYKSIQPLMSLLEK